MPRRGCGFLQGCRAFHLLAFHDLGENRFGLCGASLRQERHRPLDLRRRIRLFALSASAWTAARNASRSLCPSWSARSSSPDRASCFAAASLAATRSAVI